MLFSEIEVFQAFHYEQILKFVINIGKVFAKRLCREGISCLGFRTLPEQFFKMAAAVARARELVGQLRSTVSSNPASAKDLLIKFKVRKRLVDRAQAATRCRCERPFRDLRSFLPAFYACTLMNCRSRSRSSRFSLLDQRHLLKKQPSHERVWNMESSFTRSSATRKALSETFKC